jgi:hypothetical protein
MLCQPGIDQPGMTVVAVAMKLHEHGERPISLFGMNDVEARVLAKRFTPEANVQDAHGRAFLTEIDARSRANGGHPTLKSAILCQPARIRQQAG